MRNTCRYHCRTCESHFTSLAAFDLHRVGPFTNRMCKAPDTIKDLSEKQGICKMDDPDKPLDAKIYELTSSEEYREYRNAKARLA